MPFANNRIDLALDLANHARRRGKRIILIRGIFDQLDPDDLDRVMGQTNTDEDLILAVDDVEADFPLDARMRLAHALVHPHGYGLALAVAPNNTTLAETIRPDLEIDLRIRQFPERPRRSQRVPDDFEPAEA